MWTLKDIRDKVRSITGRKSIQQLDNDTLDKYINDYLRYDFILDVKPDALREEYVFLTEPNVRDYTITNYCNIQPEMYVENQAVDYYQDWNIFNSLTSQHNTRHVIAVGDGASNTFFGTLSSIPLQSGSLLISDDAETFTDDGGTGTLTGSVGGSGSIDYLSGIYTVTFVVPPPLSQHIYASYVSYVAGMPMKALVRGSNITFFPIPDHAYRVKVIGFKIHSSLSSPEDVLDDQGWGPLVALGAARQIFLDNGEMDRILEIDGMFRERKKLALRKTIEACNYERSMPRF